MKKMLLYFSVASMLCLVAGCVPQYHEDRDEEWYNNQLQNKKTSLEIGIDESIEQLCLTQKY